MAVQYSTTVRDNWNDNWETSIGTSAKIHIYSGSPPADCATAASGTKLAEFALASDWASASSGGTKSLSSLPVSTTGITDGTAGYYRIYDSTNTTCHEQGTVGTSGTDMIIDNTSIATSQTINITAFSKTAPGA
jgi:hypothetical protein